MEESDCGHQRVCWVDSNTQTRAPSQKLIRRVSTPRCYDLPKTDKALFVTFKGLFQLALLI